MKLLRHFLWVQEPNWSKVTGLVAINVELTAHKRRVFLDDIFHHRLISKLFAFLLQMNNDLGTLGNVGSLSERVRAGPIRLPLVR